MTPWLRRNLAALIVIVVSIPVLAFVLVVIPLQGRSGGPEIVSVAQGDSVEAGGYTFTLTASQEFPGGGTGDDSKANGIPLGSSLVGAIITAEPTGESTDATCETTLTSRAGGAERSWATVSSPTDFDYGVGDDRVTTCLLDGDPFELETVFLTPAGVYDRATIDLTVGEQTFRLALQHG